MRFEITPAHVGILLDRTVVDDSCILLPHAICFSVSSKATTQISVVSIVERQKHDAGWLRVAAATVYFAHG